MYKELLQNEEHQFDTLYRQYYPVIYKMQKKYYLRDFDQEDWLQEGRIIFYRSLERFDATHNVSIGRFFKSNFENHIRSLLRKQCAMKRTIDTTAISLDQKVENIGESFFDFIDSENTNALDQLIVQEKLLELSTLLSPLERATFGEYLEGNNLKTIAQQKKIKEPTVRSAYDRVKKKVKQLIYD